MEIASRPLQTIAQEVHACYKCESLQYAKRDIGIGQRNPDIFFVGIAPWVDENGTFSIDKGKAIKGFLKQVTNMGLTYFIDNIVKCEMPNNRKPTTEEIQNCLPYLRRSFKEIKPKVIALLGDLVIDAVLNYEMRKGHVQIRKGEFIERDSYTYFLMNHFSAPLYNPKFNEIIARQLTILKNYIYPQRYRRPI